MNWGNEAWYMFNLAWTIGCIVSSITTFRLAKKLRRKLDELNDMIEEFKRLKRMDETIHNLLGEDL